MANDNFFEKNASLLNTLGHIAGIYQRGKLIEQETAQTQSLDRISRQLQEQRNAERVKEREKELANLLYEVGQRCEELAKRYETKPQVAFYETMLLSKNVHSLQINPRQFSSLEWKDYCTKVQNSLQSLEEQGKKCLDENQVSEVLVRISEDERKEREKIVAEKEARNRAFLLQQEEEKQEERNAVLRKLAIMAAVIVIAVIGICFLAGNSNDTTALREFR